MPCRSTLSLPSTESIRVRNDASKSVTYGELIGGQKFNLALNREAKRKPASEWTVLGKPVPRLDFPAIATGRFEYVHNVRVPGMLHGRVVRPPAHGATLMSVDEQSVQKLPGVVKVVVRKNFVGVVAEKPWQAEQAARQLKAVWTAGTAAARSEHVLSASSKSDSDARHVVRGLRRRRRQAQGSRKSRSSHLHAPVPDACVDRDAHARSRT